MFTPWLDLLGESRLFEGMERDGLDQLLQESGAVVGDFRKNEIIALEGTPLEGIGFILEGSVTVGKDTVSGDRMMIARLGPGEIFGEVAAFAGKNWTATVLTEEGAMVLFLPPGQLKSFHGKASEGKYRLVLNLLHMVSDKALLLNEKIEILALKGIRRKIARYLLIHHQRTGRTRFDLPLNRKLMAEYLQVSRPSLSRELIRLKEEGVIDFTGSSFLIKDVDLLGSMLKD